MATRSMVNGIPSIFVDGKWVAIIDHFRDKINRAIFLADCDGHCTVVDKIKILPADRVTEDAPGGTRGATSKRAANSASKKFPRLSECEAVVRRSIKGQRLTENDRHIIGTLWAWLERKLLA
jgi:hypothetical protein